MKLISLIFVVLISASFLPYARKQPLAGPLREKYVAALMSYEGDEYAPYGENGGISCSTLVRRALIDAVGADSIARSVIEAHPCRSEELSEGCSGELSLVLRAPNLKKIDYTKIRTGDIAVLGNHPGIHTLAYIGDATWIHADPITGKVVISKAAEENDDWMTFEANVLRWNILKDR